MVGEEEKEDDDEEGASPSDGWSREIDGVAFYFHDDLNEDLLHPPSRLKSGNPENERGCAGGVVDREQ
jgi:hypothetical protein